MGETEIKEQNQKTKTSKLTVCSVVLGICAMVLGIYSINLRIFGFFSPYHGLLPVFLIPVIFGGSGLVFGIMSLRQIAKSGGSLVGRKIVIAGLITSVLGSFFPTWAIVNYALFFHKAKVVTIDDVASNTTLTLSADSKSNIDGISILITGDIDGSATMYIRNGGEKYPKYHIVRYPYYQKVYLRIEGDWYTNKCRFKYEPMDVHSGHLTIRYVFRERSFLK